MMNSFVENLKAGLLAQLAAVSVEQAPHLFLRDRLAVVNATLLDLSAHVVENRLCDEQQIVYHKNVYPYFKSLQLVEIEMYYLRTAVPVGDAKTIKRFFRQELRLIERFLTRYASAYEYFSRTAMELDGVYFVLGADCSSALSPVVEFGGSDGSTGMAYLFARFLCYERLAKYIIGEIEKIDRPGGLGVASVGPPAKTFQWAGETVNLIELAHGVYLDGQLDKKVGIVEFFEGLGEFFGVNLGVPKRGFEDIKRRKRLSKTHFLDRLREGILKRIDQEDGFSPKNR